MPKIFKQIWLKLFGKSRGSLHLVKVAGENESPENELRSVIGRLNSQFDDLQKSVSLAVADEKNLRLQIEEQLACAAEWESKAASAFRSGEEKLAKEALIKKEECDKAAQQNQKVWEQQKEATLRLKNSLVIAKKRIEETRRQYMQALAKFKSAQVPQSEVPESKKDAA